MQALYILGDLFEVWLGDDVLSGAAVEAAAALKAFSQTASVYFICGNRDFLVGQRFAVQAGIKLLPENQEVELYGHRYLLTHGDEMCTDDLSYQRFRRLMRNKVIQKILLLLPQQRRQKIAAKMREASKRRKQQIGRSTISDVTEQGVSTALKRYPEVDALIHGHTHRPAVHKHQFGSKIVCRYVLPDWHSGRGGYLYVSEAGVEMRSLPEAV